MTSLTVVGVDFISDDVTGAVIATHEPVSVEHVQIFAGSQLSPTDGARETFDVVNGVFDCGFRVNR